jgi:nitronate monooxygenase
MEAKAWRDIWGCGQGVGVIHDVPTVGELVERLEDELRQARANLEEKLRVRVRG